jgi:hypothetical protein
MAGFTLGRVEPVHIATDPARWEQQRQHTYHGDRRRQRPSTRARLLAALAPGRDPADCEVALDLAADGSLLGVTVRDSRTGAEIAHVDEGRIGAILGEGEAEAGLLLERRG